MIEVGGRQLGARAKLRLLRDKTAYRIGGKLKIKNKTVTKKLLGNKKVYMIPSLSEKISKQIIEGKAILLARLGGTEGVVVGEYIERKLGIRNHYSEKFTDWLYTTSGFFADDYADKEKAMDEYAELTLKGLYECDYLSAMLPTRDYMPFIFDYYATKATPTFSDFGPYFDIPIDKTWIGALKGKKVLVINSFTESIEAQYKRKNELVKALEYELPDFELITYKTYVTQVGERPDGFRNSFEVLQKMIQDISKIDFDVALIGAGAYGFPLAVEVKKMGKVAMETCGNTPLFFGIYGERNLRQGLEKYMTESWIRPIEEAPKRFKEVEGGCYW